MMTKCFNLTLGLLEDSYVVVLQIFAVTTKKFLDLRGNFDMASGLLVNYQLRTQDILLMLLDMTQFTLLLWMLH